MSSEPLSKEVVASDGPAANGTTNVTANGTPNENKARKPFSWTQPHPIFVIVLVGPNEQPFGLQKDFLCDRSEFYRKHFEENVTEKALEHIVKLPDATPEVFGLVQSYLYTGKITDESTNVTSYESLVGLWNLGHKLAVKGLCEHTLEAMVDCRRTTGRIPATPLLIQVWRDTPEGSSIRVLLLSWAAEYMRSSDARAEFAKSLPQEVLSELVVTMSSFETNAPPAPAVASAAPAVTSVAVVSALPPSSIKSSNTSIPTMPRKNVHYLDEGPDEETLAAKKKGRRSSAVPVDTGSSRKTHRKSGSSPPPKPQKRRSSAALLEGKTFSTQQKLDFCADLLNRMLSGPGFWTRLVGPFREPVDPVEDGVPDYFDKVKKPMDLSTVKQKMDQKQYTTEEEFLVDVRQIFDNCFTYWKKGDPMWAAGERLQRTFEEKYSHMNKWIAKLGGEEGE
ncbi:bromodomain-containing protein [Trichoderma breve]|uniref:Bromodomain-containing protein n=1 Tax=Trichoderma breve TaxID=2034170 RepID=A0A9W9EDY5_9HYPO|nr:bromodomain-containing protein [Trichoderma breve]KAJ4864925.1 bromodomain-containing protein [Trichoderma breve]